MDSTTDDDYAPVVTHPVPKPRGTLVARARMTRPAYDTADDVEWGAIGPTSIIHYKERVWFTATYEDAKPTLLYRVAPWVFALLPKRFGARSHSTVSTTVHITEEQYNALEGIPDYSRTLTDY